ncbi:uncharacterized protein LOC143146647 [Ptiloglossa arizonensis]|uniref:uncharacterized protein LOC143146647 n=1 Tax=Ptiloglossa arizonensis TaxID=3350558 RepID=UPI003F9F640B
MESATKPATIYKWVKRFEEERKDSKDDAREGRPSSSHTDENIERVCELVSSIASNLKKQFGNTKTRCQDCLALREFPLLTLELPMVKGQINLRISLVVYFDNGP